MVKLLDAKVNWYKEYANNPQFEVLLDRIPTDDKDFRYTLFSNTCSFQGLYVAEYQGFYSFYLQDNDFSGFGGRQFPIVMKDGRKVTLKGPWSSRAGVLNKQGLGPCGEVVFTDSIESFKRGYTFCFGLSLSVDLLKEAARLADCYVVKQVCYREAQKNNIDIPSLRLRDSLYTVPTHCEPNGCGDIYCHIDTPISPGVEFSYCPSKHSKMLVKEWPLPNIIN